MPLIGTTQKSLHSTAIKVKKYIYNNNIIIIIVKLQSSPSMGNYWNCYFWNKFCDFQATVFHIPFWSSVSWEWNIDSTINAECILISSLFHLIKWKASELLLTCCDIDEFCSEVIAFLSFLVIFPFMDTLGWRLSLGWHSPFPENLLNCQGLFSLNEWIHKYSYINLSIKEIKLLFTKNSMVFHFSDLFWYECLNTIKFTCSEKKIL